MYIQFIYKNRMSGLIKPSDILKMIGFGYDGSDDDEGCGGMYLPNRPTGKKGKRKPTDKDLKKALAEGLAKMQAELPNKRASAKTKKLTDAWAKFEQKSDVHHNWKEIKKLYKATIKEGKGPSGKKMILMKDKKKPKASAGGNLWHEYFNERKGEFKGVSAAEISKAIKSGYKQWKAQQ